MSDGYRATTQDIVNHELGPNLYYVDSDVPAPWYRKYRNICEQGLIPAYFIIERTAIGSLERQRGLEKTIRVAHLFGLKAHELKTDRFIIDGVQYASFSVERDSTHSIQIRFVDQDPVPAIQGTSLSDPVNNLLYSLPEGVQKAVRNPNNTSWLVIEDTFHELGAPVWKKGKTSAVVVKSEAGMYSLENLTESELSTIQYMLSQDANREVWPRARELFNVVSNSWDKTKTLEGATDATNPAT